MFDWLLRKYSRPIVSAYESFCGRDFLLEYIKNQPFAFTLFVKLQVLGLSLGVDFTFTLDNNNDNNNNDNDNNNKKVISFRSLRLTFFVHN